MYTPVRTDMSASLVIFLPTNNLGVIRYVLPIVVLLFSQSLIQSSIVDSRMTEYWKITVATNSSSVATSNVRVPDKASVGIDFMINRFVASVPAISYSILSLLGVTELIVNGTFTSPRTTVMSLYASSKTGFVPSKSAFIAHTLGVADTE